MLGRVAYVCRGGWLGPYKWAVIVSDDYAYGMKRMWEFLTEKSRVEILPFHTAEEATDWLGVPALSIPNGYFRNRGAATPIWCDRCHKEITAAEANPGRFDIEDRAKSLTECGL